MPFAVMVNSGSSANLLAVSAIVNNPQRAVSSGGRACRPGDAVLVPAVCWSTSVSPLLQLGLVPVLLWSEVHLLPIDPPLIRHLEFCMTALCNRPSDPVTRTFWRAHQDICGRRSGDLQRGIGGPRAANVPAGTCPRSVIAISKPNWRRYRFSTTAPVGTKHLQCHAD